MFNFKAINYYLASIFTLLTNFNWWDFPILLFKKPILIKIKSGLNLYVSNLMDIWTLKEVLVDKQYEQVQKIPKGGLVIDIGAAIGDFSINAAKKAKKVIAYECDDERVSLMKKNLELNKTINVILNHNKAVSLKEIMKGIKQCDFLKIDCEGSEYEIFANPDKPSLNKIKFIAFEVHLFNKNMEKKYQKLLTTLTKNNFEIKILPNAVHQNICFLFASNKNK